MITCTGVNADGEMIGEGRLRVKALLRVMHKNATVGRAKTVNSGAKCNFYYMVKLPKAPM